MSEPRLTAQDIAKRWAPHPDDWPTLSRLICELVEYKVAEALVGRSHNQAHHGSDACPVPPTITGVGAISEDW